MRHFRIAFGCLLFLSFARWMVYAKWFLLPDGLLDHALIAKAFPFGWMTVLPPSAGSALVYGCLIVGCLAALGIAWGRYQRIFLVVSLIITVSLNRFARPVTYVDDNLFVAFLYWLFLLSTSDKSEGLGTPAEWRLFKLFRIFILTFWFVPGLLKLTSPFWREGLALFATLKMPIAYFPDWIGPASLPYLKVLNHAALIIEVVFPVALLLPYRIPKRMAAVGLAALHLGIATTLKIPFANLMLLASLPLFFVEVPASTKVFGSRLNTRLLAAFFIIGASLLSQVNYSAVWARDLRKASWGGLGFFGIVPAYRLFNWVDKRNYSFQQKLYSIDGEAKLEKDPSLFYPPSIRGVLSMSFLIPGQRWLPMGESLTPFTEDIRRRLEANFCKHQAKGDYLAEVFSAEVIPETLGNLNYQSVPIARFKCS